MLRDSTEAQPPCFFSYVFKAAGQAGDHSENSVKSSRLGSVLPSIQHGAKNFTADILFNSHNNCNAGYFPHNRGEETEA